MESIRKALDITTSLTTNNDARRAFQLMPTLESERFQTLVHSYRRPTLTRSVSDPSIVTTKILTHTLNETPIQHNNNSSPLRRFVTMPPPSTTGRTPLTPNPNTVTIGSLRRTVSPFSATNLFPDETPDTDRISSTTESAHFSDIDEDDPSPHDDEPPSMDDDAPVVNAIDTGDVDTGDRASAPPTDMTIGDTNNPTGIDGAMPMGPSDDTHVVNSDTAASSTSKGVIKRNTTVTMQPNPGPTQRSVHTESAHPPPVTIYGHMIDSDGTVDNANTGTSVAAHSTTDPTNDITIDTTDAPADTSTTMVHGKKRRRKQNNTA